MIIAAPANASRVIEAEWVELQALRAGRCSESRLRDMTQDAYEVEDEARFDLETDEGGLYDTEILESGLIARLERVHDELRFRSETYSDAYPFHLEERTSGWTLHVKHVGVPFTERHQSALHLSYAGYFAALMISGYRHSIVSITPKPAEGRVGDVMQSLALPAATELLGGDCYWFGFPREDRTGMLEAVKRLSSNMGVGEAQPSRPLGAAVQTKDGTVDLVAWRNLGDTLSTVTVLYGQVASGVNWHGKGVRDLIDAEFFPWFLQVPRRNHYLPALFIPFPAYVEIDEPSSGTTATFRDHARARVLNDSESLGVIVDRFRLTRLLFDRETYGRKGGPQSTPIQTLHRKVREWLQDTLPPETLKARVRVAAPVCAKE